MTEKRNNEFVFLARLFTILTVLFALFYGFVAEVFCYVLFTTYLWWAAFRAGSDD